MSPSSESPLKFNLSHKQLLITVENNISSLREKHKNREKQAFLPHNNKHGPDRDPMSDHQVDILFYTFHSRAIRQAVSLVTF